MSFSYKTTVSSLESLISSINTDNQVYRWFTFLVSQRAVEQHLKDIKGIDLLYGNLVKTVFMQKSLGILLICFLITLIIFEKYLYFWLGVIFLYAFMKLHSMKKQCVVKISSHMLTHDFEQSKLSQMTLYQLAEYYSKEFKIPSFVDAIYALDDICRKSLLLIFIVHITVYMFIYQFPIWQMICSIFVIYYTIYNIINSSLVYRHLK